MPARGTCGEHLFLRNASSRTFAERAKRVPEQPAGPGCVGRTSTRRAGLTPSDRWGRSGCGWRLGRAGAAPRTVGTGLSRVERARRWRKNGHFAGEMASSRLGLHPVGFPQICDRFCGLWPENPSLANWEAHVARQRRRGRAYPLSQVIKHPHLRLWVRGIAQPAPPQRHSLAARHPSQPNRSRRPPQRCCCSLR